MTINILLVSPLLVFLARGSQGESQCVSGEVRLTDPDEQSRSVVEYCLEEQWSVLCRNEEGPNRWNLNAANVVCKQLGYRDRGAAASAPCSDIDENSQYTVLTSPNICSGLENSLSECGPQSADPYQDCRQNNNCNDDQRAIAQLTCRQANCQEARVRLVNGTTNREGRVEICQSGHWGTVCGEGLGDREAGLVCRELGFPAEGAEVRLHNFGQGTAPVYSCTFEDDLPLNFTCDQAADSCSHSMDIGVVCRSHDQVAGILISRAINETIQNISIVMSLMTPSTETSTPYSDTSTADISNKTLQNIPTMMSLDNTANSSMIRGSVMTALGVVVGILVVLLMGVVTGWVISCGVLMKRKSKRQTKIKLDYPQTNDQEVYQRQLDNPVYCTSEDTQLTTGYSSSGPTYEHFTNQGAGLTCSTLDQNNGLMSAHSGLTMIDEEQNYHMVGREGVEVGGCEDVYSVPDTAGNRTYH